MRKLPALKTLECFEQAAGHPSFSSAAEAIGMTHGAISHQIRTLEDWLGVELFTRHPGGVHLTEDGRRLKQACTFALSTLEDECARLRRQSHERAIAVGCSATFLAQWLLPRAESFSSGDGGSTLSFQTRADTATLLAGNLDVLITSASDEPPDGIERFRLAEDRIGPVCAPKWLPHPATPAEVAVLPWLHAQSRPNAWNEWAVAVGIEFGQARGRQFESLSLTIEAACGGLGLAMTPEFLVRDELLTGRLVAPLGFVQVKRSTWIYIRRRPRPDPEIGRFVGWLIARAKDGF